jgi:hypothetical protein
MPTKIFVSQIDDTLNDGSPAPLDSIIYLGNDGPTWKLIAEIYPVGFKGSAGFIGSAGFRGSVGLFGEPGFRGSEGDMGSQGPAGFRGSNGYFGSLGYKGSAGYLGSVGDIGFQGSNGDFGVTGYQGSEGGTGFQGSNGFRGSLGISGYTGSKGAIDPFGFLELSDVASRYATYNDYHGAHLRVSDVGDGIVFDNTELLSNNVTSTINFNNNILNLPVLKGYSETVVGELTGDPITCNPVDGNIFKITLNTPITNIALKNYFNEANMLQTNFYTISLFLKQGDGNNLVDWTNDYYVIYWSVGDGVTQEIGPILSISQNYIDIITLSTYDGGVTWFGVLGAKGFYVP